MLYECFGGPLDGQIIAERGASFIVGSTGATSHRGLTKAGQGWYELRKDGYHWHPPATGSSKEG